MEELAAEKLLKEVAAWHPPMAVSLVHAIDNGWKRPTCSKWLVIEIDAPKYFNRDMLADTVKDLSRAQTPECWIDLYYNDGSIIETQRRSYSRFGFVGVTWGSPINKNPEKPLTRKEARRPQVKVTREALVYAPSLLRFNLSVEYADVMKAIDENSALDHPIEQELMTFLEQWGWEPKIYR